jgi:hypothetical protein
VPAGSVARGFVGTLKANLQLGACAATTPGTSASVKSQQLYGD